MRKPNLGESAGETQTVQESEAECEQPRIILRDVASLGWVAKQ